MTGSRPILLTGTQRSGLTWAGKMIAKSSSVGYIHEPFVKAYWPGMSGYKFARFKHWFAYLSDENGQNYYEPLKKTMMFHYSPLQEFKVAESPKDLARTVRDFTLFSMYRVTRRRPLVKDPIALFSAEWLAETFDMDVVISIRHPAAYVGSMKKLNWKIRFSNFLEQPLLMGDHLYPFKSEIEAYAQEDRDIVDVASLLWKISHYMISKYKKKHKNWFFYRHEDLSRDPVKGFENIFKKLNLDFSERIRAKILEYSGPVNPGEPSYYRSIRRDSKANIWLWKKRLTLSEIRKIRDQVEDVSKEFYADEDW